MSSTMNKRNGAGLMLALLAAGVVLSGPASANESKAKPEPKAEAKGGGEESLDVLRQRLAERLGSAVQIRHGKKGKGQLVIGYNSLDELQGVLAHIR